MTKPNVVVAFVHSCFPSEESKKTLGRIHVTTTIRRLESKLVFGSSVVRNILRPNVAAAIRMQRRRKDVTVVADGTNQRLLALVARLDLRGDAERWLADINRVATSELRQ